jgi:acetylornithine deacetylase/succinyl-diaminopimelate desuccinylase-like protein
VNIKVVWEGEEENGSPHLAATLRADPALFASDLWLIGDGPVHQSMRPTIYFGARGVLSVEATIYGATRALHSGHYGNWAPNPAAMAATLLAELRDDTGKILVPGIEDDVRPLTPAEQDAIRNLPPIEEALRKEIGIARSEGDETLAASLMRPALNVRGIRSGQVGAAAVTAIPTTALVSIDFRLVPDQTPEKLRQRVEAFLKSKGWTVVSGEPDPSTRLAHPRIVRLEWNSGYPALRSDLSTPAARAVIAAANRASNGTTVVLPMMGGSVPIYLLAEIFKTPVIGLPIVNHDNNQHAANENLRLQNLWNGIQTYASMMGALDW